MTLFPQSSSVIVGLNICKLCTGMLNSMYGDYCVNFVSGMAFLLCTIISISLAIRNPHLSHRSSKKRFAIAIIVDYVALLLHVLPIDPKTEQRSPRYSIGGWYPANRFEGQGLTDVRF